MKIHQLISVLYVKFVNHLLSTITDTGVAIIKDITTHFMKSEFSLTKISETIAPNTFRTPISFVCWFIVNNINPNRPSKDIDIERIAKIKVSLPINKSLKYLLFISSSRK